MKAVTRPLDREVDLNSFARGDGLLFVRDGVGVAGRGVAARVPVDDVDAVLGAMERDDVVGQPGSGPIAIGALPFHPGANAELIVPAVTIGKGPDGGRWITCIDGAEADLEPGPSPASAGGSFSVRPGVPVDTYLAAVVAGREQVRAGRPHEGRDRPRHLRGGRPPAGRARHPAAAPGHVRVELPVLGRGLRGRLAGAARRPSR